MSRTFTLVIIIMMLSPSHIQAGFVLNGAPICSAEGAQYAPVIVTDHAGGAIIAWSDERWGWGYSGVYVQRINAVGESLWAEDGIALRLTVAACYDVQAIDDGSGGAIIVWTDLRNSWGGFSPDENADIYIGRVDGDGNILWGEDGFGLCTESARQFNPRIIGDGNGGAIVIWQDERAGDDIYGQRINAEGTPLWAIGGVPVCADPNYQTAPAIASDGAGGAIIAWEDNRGGGKSIYAQRLDSSGDPVWSSDGVPVCTAEGLQRDPKLAPDGAHGAIIVWYNDYEDDLAPKVLSNTIAAQRISGSSGETLWAADGVIVCATDGFAWYPDIVADGYGGAIIGWQDNRNSTPENHHDDVYAQRLDGEGVPLWTLNGTLVCGAAGYQENPSMAADGSGGAFFVWPDKRVDYEECDIYTQVVTGDGTVLWAADGIPLSVAPGYQYRPQVISDGAGGAFFTWAENSSPTQDPSPRDIYAARVNDSGAIVPTLLQEWSAELDRSAIRLSWSLFCEDPTFQFRVLRSDHNDPREYRFLDDARIERSGSTYVFRDVSCQQGNSYIYQVILRGNGEDALLFQSERITVPLTPLVLNPCFPNPFNPRTTVWLDIPRAGGATLAVHDLHGRLVRTLVSGQMNAGRHPVVWDGLDDRGAQTPSGVYLVRLVTADGAQRAVKVTLSK
jgi:hypothetical protein